MKKLVSLLVSFSLLAWLYWKMDWGRFAEAVSRCSWGWLSAGLAMFVPVTLAIAWRLHILGRSHNGALGYFESLRLILSGSVMNLVLPAKMGDIAKAWFIAGKQGMSGPHALALVIYEKACDVLALLLWCGLGLAFFSAGGLLFWIFNAVVAGGFAGGCMLLFFPFFSRWLFQTAERLPFGPFKKAIRRFGGAWLEMTGRLTGGRRRLAGVAVLSAGIWLLHLLQIWLFILALRAEIPLLDHLALTPLAILAGLIPFTFAGIGTRDAALFFFYQNHADYAVLAALGMLCTVRYLLPAICGLPFFHSCAARPVCLKPAR